MYGVVGIFWHKDLDQIVGMVEGGNERIQCIEVNQISSKPILIICVYMPTSGGSVKTIEYHKICWMNYCKGIKIHITL